MQSSDGATQMRGRKSGRSPRPFNSPRALADDDELAVSFLCVVAVGIDVVTETQLAAASYVPGRLSATQYLRHARACERTGATLSLAESLDVECPVVRAALRRIARAP